MGARIAMTRTLEDIARFVRTHDDRRKTFVWVSEGRMGVTTSELLVDEFDDEQSMQVGKLMEELTRSNVGVYAIDPRGHVPDQRLLHECFPPPAGAMFDPCLGIAFGQIPKDDNYIARARQGLDRLSRATGGFAVLNTDDFATGIDRILGAIDHYYLLGFYPTNPKGWGFRPIQVTVNRQGVTVHFRRGYDTGGRPKAPKNPDPLSVLHAGLLPKTDLPVRLYAAVLPTASKQARVVTAIEVSAPRKDLADQDGRVDDEVRYAVIAGDLRVGKVRRQVRRTVQVSAPFSSTSASATFRHQTYAEMMLAPGRYQIRASALSRAAGKGGSAYIMIEVPTFASAPIALSSLVLGRAGASRVPSDGAPPGLPLEPTLDREFTSGDTLRLYVEIATKQRDAAPHACVDVLDSDGRVLASMHPSADRLPGRPASVDLEIPLQGFAPGAYRLRVTATESTDMAMRGVGFLISPGSDQRP
jgi:hypothetical protein